MTESSVLVRCNAQRKPKATVEERIELPPYDTNGSVIPVIGISPIFMPVLMNIWDNNIANNPME
jgi:hypothetical protein